ncbi:hypothetical protein [Synechococcus sp. Cruz CV12-2-Slac-r]|uniref:hypothetical protein n=1 Tax=Synechococcus sp. Cruz CV12-2-Slac-r TaxID=2823748 RepID=UPI0020CCE452|nr:hypothetical protein [Synechococcus sp. Cruz CV12-2-Slac-r]MCP9940109.1 hypothetical protein [Synechococcus sp. Cruz CV12-2-Slac-r]MCX5929796.1 hypothetical protein [Synechococcus sp. LacPavin_0920_WC12_MAG_50_7]
MVAHPLSASARARKELEALKLALAEKDEAALRLLSERYAHRQGPKALQILIRKLASTEEMATFWQLQLLPKEIPKVEISHTEFTQEEVAQEELIQEEIIEVEISQQPPLEIKARSEVARRLRGWLPSWDGPLRQAS